MAANDNTIPVYLITGFLDSGKTNFLKFTMQEDYFNDGSRTLLILCEEGEEDYPVKVLRKTHTDMEIIDEESDLTAEKLEELNRRPFKKRAGCRFSAFEEEEKEFMRPLPATAYEPSVWSHPKVSYPLTNGALYSALISRISF